MAQPSNDNDGRMSPLPTFLNFDPFPSSREGRPISSGTIGTTASSEWDVADYQSAKERQSTVPSVTGPVGEPGLPPPRPTSSAPSNVSGSASVHGSGSRVGGTLSPSSSRRGYHGVGGTRSNNSIRGRRSPVPHEDRTRPGSAMSNTHVTGLAAQGFSRPMSSQQLQQQRQRPASVLDRARPSLDVVDEPETKHRHRYSDASVNTMRDQPPILETDIPPLPVSRGTLFTQHQRDDSAGETVEGSQDGYGARSVISKNSTTPLQGHKSPEPSKVQGGNLAPIAQDRSPRSTTSFRASLRLNSKRASRLERTSTNILRHDATHKHLPSDPSSPADGSNMQNEKLGFPSKQASSQPEGRNYEYFAGNMLFFLSGRFMNTKAKPLNVVTLILTVLPAALFFGFEAPWLWHNLSPAVPIIFAYVFYLAVSSFLHAAFSDPGILPRNIHPHPPNPAEDADPLVPGPATTEWVVTKTFSQAPTINGDGVAQPPAHAMEVPTKYCKSCNIWRPPRAHHCRVCDGCIETQDHHCVWLNNCVGRRNYRFFFGYVGWSSVLAFLLIAFSISHIALYGHKHGMSFGKSLSGRTQERVAFALFIYSILALPYPGSLLGYHIFLVARGETTREYLNSHKFAPRDRHRPWTQASMIRNWLAVLLRPRPPSYLQFKRPHRPGDQRLGYDVRKKDRKLRAQAESGKYTVEKEASGGTELQNLGRPSGGDGGGTNRESALGRGGLNNTPRF